MHKSTERPIEVKSVILLDALSPPDGPTQHTREATRQAASTWQVGLESNLNSNPPYGLATQEMIISDDPVSLAIPRHKWFEWLSSHRTGTLPESSSQMSANPRHTKKHRQTPIRPYDIWWWRQRLTLSNTTTLGTWLNYQKIDVLFHANGSTD